VARAPSIEEEHQVQVLVRDNNVDQALKVLKKKMQREGVFHDGAKATFPYGSPHQVADFGRE
jgi:ribosomal protein S21